jgi:hypothetical protein
MDGVKLVHRHTGKNLPIKFGYALTKCKCCGGYAYANANTTAIMSEDKICWLCKQMKITPKERT